MEAKNVQDTTQSKLFAKSNLAPSMVDILNGVTLEPVPNLVEVEPRRVNVPVPTPHQNMVEENALVLQSTHSPVTLKTARSMVDGQHGLCGDRVLNHVVVDEHTDNEDVPIQNQCMAEICAQVLQSRRNNVEPSHAQSMVDGPTMELSEVVHRHAVEVNKWLFDIVTTQHQCTMETPAQDPIKRYNPVTPKTAQLMVNTHHGNHGVSARTVVEAVPKLVHEHAHHPSMEVKDAKCSGMPPIPGNATLNCVQ
jgi:hypothetical protein